MKDAVSRAPLLDARIALIAFLVVVLLFLNARFPRVRFESQAANIRFGMILDWLPLCVGVFALCSRPRRIGIPIGLLCLLVCPFLAFAFLIDEDDLALTLKGNDQLFHPSSEVWQGPIRVRTYSVDAGTLGGVGFCVRQEFRLFPGLLLVRELYREADTADGGKVKNLRPGMIQIQPQSANGADRRAIDMKLRSFLSI